MADSNGGFGAILAAVGIFVIAIVGHGISTKLDAKQLKQLESTITRYESFVSKVANAETELKETELFKQMEKIYGDEKLVSSFDQAKQKLKAQSTEVAKLKEVQKKNSFWSTSKTMPRIAAVNGALDIISGDLKKPHTELERIKKLIDELIQTNTVVTTLASLKATHSQLQTKANRQKGLHKDKAGKIDIMMNLYGDKFALLDKHSSYIGTALTKKYQMDYREFITTKAAFDKLSASVSTSLLNDSNSLDSLDTSYTKILSDMKDEMQVRFGYSTWDEYAEWENTANFVTAWVKIEEDDDFYAMDDAGDLVASCSSGWGATTCTQHVPNIAKYLKLAIPRSGDTHVEFWVEQSDAKFWHKYKIEKDGKITETDWVPVTEEFYWANVKNEDMALETKPIGSFTDETVKEATPPGLGYVGNPNYGSYNSSGNWVFLPMFLGSFGGNDYTRNDYEHYRDHRTEQEKRRTTGTSSASAGSGGGYYGRNNSFGTGGTRMASGNTAGGGNTTMSRSSRNAGSSSRSRGAGGGGK